MATRPETSDGAMWRAIQVADRFVRLHLIFFTALWLLLGVASVARGIGPREIGALLGIIVCFHVFAYVLNDVVDLPIDRTQPARQRDPLVLGLVRPWQALLLALVQPLLTMPLTRALAADPMAQPTLYAGFGLMAAYNVWGKKCPFPPLTDALQGLAWSSLAIYAPHALGATPTVLTWIVAAYAVVFTMFINGIHGSLRDLANDLATGARTTALLLGARPSRNDRGTHVPVQMAIYAWWVLGLLIALNALLLLRNDFHYHSPAWTAIAIVVGALNLWAVLLQPRVLYPRGRASDSAWRLQMYVMLLSLPIAFVAYTSVEVLSVLALLNLLALILWESTSVVTRWAWSTICSALPAAPRESSGRMALSRDGGSDSRPT